LKSIAQILKQITVGLLVLGLLGCKPTPEPVQSEQSEVNAFNISDLWGWFGRYADDVGKFLSGARNSDAAKSLIKVVPLSSLDDVAKIFSINLRQVPRLSKKLSSLKQGKLALNDFPLKSLPKGIPSKYERAFSVALSSLKNYGSEKIAARQLSAQMVRKFSIEKGISEAKAYEDQLVAFTRANFGTAPMPLPNEFAGVNTFYGHMLKHNSPFLDVAFGPGGILGPSKAPEKATHGVFVHIEDFFEWGLLCQMKGCGSATLPELMRYIARSGIAENAAVLQTKLEKAKSLNQLDEVSKLQEELDDSISLLGLSKDGSDILKLRRGETIFIKDDQIGSMPMKLLDWESTTSFRNSTGLWDVFFDFQNLSDDAFKEKDRLRAVFNNPAEGFLASSMNVTSNPMYMGRPELLETFFKGIGWH
jgi:hypothetical protein